MSRSFVFLLVLAALVSGCEKNSDSPGNAAPASSAAASLTDFPSLDPSAWVNGAPTSLARLRGNVVLVEAWHRL